MDTLARAVADELSKLRDVDEVEVTRHGEEVKVRGLARTSQGDRRFSFVMPPPVSPLAAVGRVRRLCKIGE